MSVLITEVPINFSPLTQRYTLEEFWQLPDPEDHSHYELIGGLLFVAPPPNPPHDDLDARLTKGLILYLAAKGLEGDVHDPPAPIYREEGTYLEPDMMYVSPELKEQMGKKRTSADIVFEYISKSNATYDRTTKADTYLLLGVRELWLVDAATATIEVRTPGERKGKPVWERQVYAPGDIAESEVLEGWRVSVNELFEGLL